MSRAPNCIDSQWTGLPLAGFAVLLVATGGENTGRRNPEIHATTFGGEGVLLGKPVGRSDEVSLLPSIFLENPAVGDSVHSPLHMTGMSNTYEATIQAQLVAANGHTVVDHSVTAMAGTAPGVPSTPASRTRRRRVGRARSWCSRSHRRAERASTRWTSP